MVTRGRYISTRAFCSESLICESSCASRKGFLVLQNIVFTQTVSDTVNGHYEMAKGISSSLGLESIPGYQDKIEMELFTEVYDTDEFRI